MNNKTAKNRTRLSLIQVRPDLAEEWSTDKNIGISPYSVSYGSHKKVWWKCKTCGFEWEAIVKDRVSGRGCPNCYKQNRGIKKSQGHARINGSFFKDNSNLLNEWDVLKNKDLNPENYSKGSHKIVWWICQNGHEWKAPIRSRVEGSGCPICAGKTLLTGFNDLRTKHPSLATEWNYERNDGLRPEEVYAGSGKRVWWRCKYGHEWKASVDSRVRGRGCPVCANRVVVKGLNDLLSQDPSLAEQWNYERNFDLSPDSIYVGSNRKIWWRCNKGHEWEAGVGYRHQKKIGCPYCSNQRVQSGYNDLATLRPDLLNSWNYKRNENVRPTEILPSSQLKVWWICPNGHEWNALVYSVVSGSGCPICGRKKLLENGYKTRLKKSGSLEQIRPDLVAEWDFEKNTDILPSQITSKSNKKVWWKCSRGHQWYASIVNRSRLGRGCPYCSNQIPIVGENDLQTLYPEIAAQWHPAKNQQLTPKDVTAGSKRLVWWICEKGHEYASLVRSRTSRKTGCPYCANKAVLKGFNDLETTSPSLATEWDISRNEGLLPSMVTSGSGKKVWWLCKFGHSFSAIIYNRVKGEGCPICSGRLRTSFPEQAIFYYIKKCFPDAVSREIGILGNKMELDVFIPSIKTAIEYDGKVYHSKPENQKRDLRKYQICQANNIALIRIVENTGIENSEATCDYQIDIENGRTQYLQPAIWSLMQYLGKGIEVDIERDQNEILEYLNETQTSMESEFPEIAKEWHPTKNGSLLPIMFYPGSNVKVWWKCSKCGKEWRTSIFERTGKDKTGCPRCNRFIGAAKNVQTRIHKKGSLQSNCPELMAEWDYSKNKELDPQTLTCGSGVRAWWKCSYCGHEWSATINHRTKGRGCPSCKPRKIAEKSGKPVSMISTETNTVIKTFPSIAEAYRETGIHNIQRGLKNPFETVGGYYWRYSS